MTLIWPLTLSADDQTGWNRRWDEGYLGFVLPLQRVPLRGFIVLMPIIINLGWQSMYIINPIDVDDDDDDHAGIIFKKKNKQVTTWLRGSFFSFSFLKEKEKSTIFSMADATWSGNQQVRTREASSASVRLTNNGLDVSLTTTRNSRRRSKVKFVKNKGPPTTSTQAHAQQPKEQDTQLKKPSTVQKK